MHCKSYSHFFSKKCQNICVSLDVNFNESLTNDVVSFEQLGPDRSKAVVLVLFLLFVAVYRFMVSALLSGIFCLFFFFYMYCDASICGHCIQ